jgi:hypothetical protein
MATFIQEVLGLLAKKKTVNTLIKDKDYFELGRKRDSKLVTGGYSPEMDALAIKAEDLMCVMLSNTLQGGVNYVPIFSPPIPGSNCPKGPLVNSKLYQNPSTGTLEFKDDAKFEHGVIDTAGSYGTAGQVLTSTVTGVQWTTNGSGTVTSVDASGGTTGLTFSGGPVVSSGVLTLGGTLGAANGGTGLSQTPLQNQLLFGNASAGYSLVTLTGGTGISYNVSSGNLFITNTAPDQVVSITAGANVTVTGSYPNFTVAASAAATARKAYLGIQWRGATNPYFSIPFNSPTEIPFDAVSYAYIDGGAAGIGFYNPTPTEARVVPGESGLYRIRFSLNIDAQSQQDVHSLRAWLFNNSTGQRVLQLIATVPATSAGTDRIRIYQGTSDYVLTQSNEYSIILEITGSGTPGYPVLNYAVTELVIDSIKI